MGDAIAGAGHSFNRSMKEAPVFHAVDIGIFMFQQSLDCYSRLQEIQVIAIRLPMHPSKE